MADQGTELSRCEAVRSNGKRCKNPAAPDRLFCPQHDPDRSASPKWAEVAEVVRQHPDVLMAPRCSRCGRVAPPEDSDEFRADWIVKEEDGEVVLVCNGCIPEEERQEAMDDLPRPLTAEELERRRRPAAPGEEEGD